MIFENYYGGLDVFRVSKSQGYMSFSRSAKLLKMKKVKLHFAFCDLMNQGVQSGLPWGHSIECIS